MLIGSKKPLHLVSYLAAGVSDLRAIPLEFFALAVHQVRYLITSQLLRSVLIERQIQTYTPVQQNRLEVADFLLRLSAASS
jgi:hypothetical protein